jgi:hypothetical protein
MALSRRWDRMLPVLVFVMLNPSTADASVDDPTIRKCVGFAKRNGYGGILVVNLFAYRATEPRDLWRAAQEIDIVGPKNDEWILEATYGRPTVLAWGAQARGWKRPDEVTAMLQVMDRSLFVLGRTIDGIPRHPLMLPYTSELRWIP